MNRLHIVGFRSEGILILATRIFSITVAPLLALDTRVIVVHIGRGLRTIVDESPLTTLCHLRTPTAGAH